MHYRSIQEVPSPVGWRDRLRGHASTGDAGLQQTMDRMGRVPAGIRGRRTPVATLAHAGRASTTSAASPSATPDAAPARQRHDGSPTLAAETALTSRWHWADSTGPRGSRTT
ncbi:hypothetical protein Rumeso_02859 [Rubellimicrobium mesophilum DSM 19309]|uniref:Uncharacterized protein n=1 Tax=Rubellimicrobium mesophilum DSM 19309 TaxID=442562 RepID=A0A017HN78_9RHOB|nr:hypothetical protein Rumeso_02859 [Rubellimicrobium mesophilum DSM 19309]